MFHEVDFKSDKWDMVLPPIGTHRNNFAEELYVNCIHSLIYQPKIYTQLENMMFAKMREKMLNFYFAILRTRRFDKYIHNISENVLCATADLLVYKTISSLAPILKTKARIAEIANLSGSSKLKEIGYIEDIEDLFNGNIEKYAELRNTTFNTIATKYAIEGNIAEAITYFSKSLREQQKSGNKAPVPQYIYYSYFYFVTLLLLDQKISMPIFQKILRWVRKNPYGYHLLFNTIVYDKLNEDKHVLNAMKESLKTHIKTSKADTTSLINIIICYLINEKLDASFAVQVSDITKKDYDGG
jgi:tetratricopeptide (TPR) repeat protein